MALRLDQINSIERANLVVSKLIELGCQDVCLCPGGRNAPFVEILSKNSAITTKTFFDERSAAFFAIGKIKKEHRPVVVITTSGTAVAELFPAVIEAFYSNLPLIVVSADRPKRLRQSGSPQTINQVNIYGMYTPNMVDLSVDFKQLESVKCTTCKPVHINVCFEEPLLPASAIREVYKFDKPEASPSFWLNSQVNQSDHEEIDTLSARDPGLIVVGALRSNEVNTVKNFLIQSHWPVYLEFHSGLQNDPDLGELEIKRRDGYISHALKKNLFSTVLRIGGVPTARFWRDLENLPGVEIINFSNNLLSGMGRVLKDSFSIEKLPVSQNKTSKVSAESKKFTLSKMNEDLYVKYPNSEQAFMKKLTNLIPIDSHIFIGNSLPIRIWDLVNSRFFSKSKVYTSRGTNGIDGLLSMFLGACDRTKKNFAILGDLTTLYDLNAAWIWQRYFLKYDITLIVINNGGGKIFTPLFNNSNFENNHEVSFQKWAEMFGLTYNLLESVENLSEKSFNSHIVELRPNNSMTSEFVQDLSLGVKSLEI